MLKIDYKDMYGGSMYSGMQKNDIQQTLQQCEINGRKKYIESCVVPKWICPGDKRPQIDLVTTNFSLLEKKVSPRACGRPTDV